MNFSTRVLLALTCMILGEQAKADLSILGPAVVFMEKEATYSIANPVAPKFSSSDTSKARIDESSGKLTPVSQSSALNDVIITVVDGKDEGKKKVTIGKAVLDFMKVDHNKENGILPKQEKKNPGAFLPLNNDDDDYDAKNLPDKDQTGKIEDEDDLLTIVMRKIEPAALSGKYKIVVPAQVRLYKKEERQDLVLEKDKFKTDEDTKLFVEGIQKGELKLKLDWSEGNSSVDDVDQGKVTVFEWKGPLNVPGYSKHQYKVEGAPSSAKWLPPDTGAIVKEESPLDVDILWGEGGGTKASTAKLQVDDNYVWDLQVNVVRFVLFTPDKALDTDQRMKQRPGEPLIVVSSPDFNVALRARAHVSSVYGPIIKNKHRGGKFMEMGFINNASMSKQHAEFNDTQPKLTQTSKLQNPNVYYLDTVSGSKIPWYNSDSKDTFYKFKTEPQQIGFVGIKLIFEDRPSFRASYDFILNGDTVDYYHNRKDFKLFFVVRTTDTVNKANERYTVRQKVSWWSDCSGPLTDGHWRPDSTAGTFIEGNAQNFQSIKDGSYPDVIVKPIMNDLTDQNEPSLGNWVTQPK